MASDRANLGLVASWEAAFTPGVAPRVSPGALVALEVWAADELEEVRVFTVQASAGEV